MHKSRSVLWFLLSLCFLFATTNCTPNGNCPEGCPSGESCQEGKCVKDAKDPCRDKKCPSGESCQEGKCVKDASCDKGTTACGKDCAKLDRNPQHCGACGKACAKGEVCMLGQCESECGISYTSCNGACVDLKRSGQNCGACGTTCKDGKSCSDGKCVDSCPEGQTTCDGACVDVQFDSAHCGKCFSACESGFACLEGACNNDVFFRSTWLTIANGSAISNKCRFYRRKKTNGIVKYYMYCNGIQRVKMEGKISGSTYSLRSSNPITTTGLVTSLLTALLKTTNGASTASDTIKYITKAFNGLGNIYLSADNEKGFHLTGTADYGNTVTTIKNATDWTGYAGRVISLFHKFFQHFVPGYNPSIKYAIIPTANEDGADVTLSVTPISTCISKTVNSKVGTKIKFNSLSVNLTLAYDGTSVSFTGGLSGLMYLQLTKNDDWIKVTPSINVTPEFGANPDVSITIGGEASGSCGKNASSCAADCSCNTTNCNDDWKPLGQQIFSVNGVQLEIGISAKTPNVPLISFSASGVKIAGASTTGQFGATFDLGEYHGGFYVEADTLKLRDALKMLDSLPPEIENPLNKTNIQVDNFVFSYATTPMTVGASASAKDIDVGYNMSGDVTVSGLTGTLKTNQVYSPAITLESLQSGQVNLFGAFGIPQGSIELKLNINSLQQNVLDLIPEPFKTMAKKTFSLKSLFLLFDNSGPGTSLKASAKMSFQLAGNNYKPSFSFDKSLDTQEIAQQLYRQVQQLLSDPAGAAGKIFKWFQDTGKAIASEADNFIDCVSGNNEPSCKSYNNDYKVKSKAFGCYQEKTKSKTCFGKKRSKTCKVPSICGGCWFVAKDTSKEIGCAGGVQGGRVISIEAVGCINASSSGYGGPVCDAETQKSPNTFATAQANSRCRNKMSCSLSPGGVGCSGQGFYVKYSCVPCPLGQEAKYNASTKRWYCSSCPSGKARWNTNQLLCEYCPKSTQPDSGQTTCIPCTPGTSGSNPGACSACQAGTYQPSTGAERCEPCPTGTYQDEEGQASCKACPFGTYSYKQSKQKSECRSCPSGQTGCADVCKNLQTDSNHCGICGNKCENGKTCQKGQCK